MTRYEKQSETACLCFYCEHRCLWKCPTPDISIKTLWERKGAQRIAVSGCTENPWPGDSGNCKGIWKCIKFEKRRTK